MPTSAPEFSTLANSLRLIRCLGQRQGKRLVGAAVLIAVIGLLDGGGLLLLLPLLQSLGIPSEGLPRFDTRSVGSPALPLPVLLAILAAVKATQVAVRAWSGYLNLKLQSDFVGHLRARFYQAMMSAEWLLVTRQRSSDVTHALLHEVPSLGTTTHHLLALAGLGTLAIVQVAVAIILSPLMTLLALGAGGLIGLGLRSLRRRAHRHAEEGYGRRAEMAAIVTEHLAGLKIAKSHGREETHYQHFLAAMHSLIAHSLRQFRFNAFTQIWGQLGATIALGFFVWFAIDVQHVATAQLLVLAFTFSRLLNFVSTLQSTWHDFTLALPTFASTERLRERLLAGAEAPRPAQIQRLELREVLRLNDVSFAYNVEAPRAGVRQIDLTLPARQVTALCGPSGAGKSTVADLVLGLLTPDSGTVTIDGKPLQNLLHDWRHSIGYVPQETFLFHDTVRANLLWASPEATEPELRAALDAAAAMAFVDRLPQGLDTMVGDRGVRLSGGERQRIALARALLRKPTLLVLDEATSSLDPQNERLVQDAIERLHGELTILLIAHRLSTVRMADCIVVLEQGAVVETGTWDQLSTREGGAFHRLISADTHR